MFIRYLIAGIFAFTVNFGSDSLHAGTIYGSADCNVQGWPTIHGYRAMCRCYMNLNNGGSYGYYEYEYNNAGDVLGITMRQAATCRINPSAEICRSYWFKLNGCTQSCQAKYNRLGQQRQFMGTDFQSGEDLYAVVTGCI